MQVIEKFINEIKPYEKNPRKNDEAVEYVANSKCYMAELDPKYCSVILQRYINFKGSDVDVFLLKDGEKIPYSEVNS